MIQLAPILKESISARDKAYSWQDPNGEFHPVTSDTYSHGSMAFGLLGRKFDNSDAVYDLFKQRWNRIAYSGDTIYIHNEAREPSPQQIKAVIDIAMEGEFSKVRVDRGDNYKLVWSEFDTLQEKNTLDEGRGTKGFWMSSSGKMIEAPSHEAVAIKILQKLVQNGRLSQQDYDRLNIPLNSTSEVEAVMYRHNFVRMVFDYLDSTPIYYVNGERGQPLSHKQLSELRNFGAENDVGIIYLQGENEYTGAKTIFNPNCGKNFDALQEKKFRDSSKITHIADFPMFSVFVDSELSDDYKKTVGEMQDSLKKIFGDARHEIHRLGFPSMHANVVLKDLSEEVNHITGGGEFTGGCKGVGGYAIAKGKYMVIDIGNIYTNSIVHEWAHLWMMNNSEEFKKAVKALYTHMQNQAASQLQPDDISSKLTPQEERVLLDKWSEFFTNLVLFFPTEPTISSFIIKGKKITPDMLQFLPHNLTIPGMLKKSLDTQSLRGGFKTLPENSEVYAEKIHDGWIVGAFINKERYETVIRPINQIFEYLDSKTGRTMLDDITSQVKDSSTRYGNKTSIKSLTQNIKQKIQSGMIHYAMDAAEKSGINPSPDKKDFEIITQWANDIVVPKYLQVLRNKKILYQLMADPKKAYDYFWTSNDLKPETLSFISLMLEEKKRGDFKKFHSTMKSYGGLSKPENALHRDAMQRLNQWVSSYGMANDSELWATAIDSFFQLPKNNQKAIIKLMMRM